MAWCADGEYFDAVVNECSPCRDICSQTQPSLDSCVFSCPRESPVHTHVHSYRSNCITLTDLSRILFHSLIAVRSVSQKYLPPPRFSGEIISTPTTKNFKVKFYLLIRKIAKFYSTVSNYNKVMPYSKRDHLVNFYISLEKREKL